MIVDPSVQPEWPAPARVRTLVTTRQGGVSAAPYDSLNLGDHVGDDPERVGENRAQVEALLPGIPAWLNQVHGTRVLELDEADPVRRADAAVARKPGQVCVVMTADCLPVLLCDREGGAVAAAHAGWRGLADGVLEATVWHMGVPPYRLMAWLGPAIGSQAFEVGQDVFDACTHHDARAANAFLPAPSGVQGKYLADLYTLARLRLEMAGVWQVFGGRFCTYSDPERFFSYRRDGVTGRMASLIWLAP